ncbi:hypothetical protein [Erythrobacter sp. Dej080120_24]|uniref:hypothetical protein n=1 Tax=Erythrobacter sp. Dej080120_24 TaxID=3024837 RepID=UPI0030C75DD4
MWLGKAMKPCQAPAPSPAKRTLLSRRSRPPFFVPVKLRARKDGWSARVQCAFLAQLYATGSVSAAARSVGKSRESAYRLKSRAGAESFASAWDRVLAGPTRPGEHRPRHREIADWRKVTLEQLEWRIETGFWRPVLYRGKQISIVRKPDNSALFRLLRRIDAQADKAEARRS